MNRWIASGALSALLCLACGSLQAHDVPLSLLHWEIASPEPDRIFLSFAGNASSSRAVTWRTNASVTSAFAEIAPALAEPRFDRKARRLKAKTESVKLDAADLNTQGAVHYHSAVFEGLKPGTLYAYRVGDGGEHWSEWIQFRTAQADTSAFSFVYFGDAQNDLLSHWSRVIRMAAQTAPNAAFALHAGDLINRAHSDREWAEWFKAGGWLHGQWTGIPVAGNHEYSPLRAAQKGAAESDKILSLTWRPQFTLPLEKSLPASLQETVYTVDYQGAQIIVLNSNIEIDAQIPYLEAQLKKPGPRWRIVSFHHPIFSPARDRDNPKVRAAWKPLFDKYGVDLVLQGHDHTYARGQVPVRSQAGFEKNTVQTMYVTSVSGPKMYDIVPGKFAPYEAEGLLPIRQAENTQFFQVIRIDGARLSYEAYTATGDLYDSAVLTKDFATGKKTIQQQIPNVAERTHQNTEPYIDEESKTPKQ